ncbi:hypothetical protein DVR12_23215 [Chitinophaga silvatica]|uniref:Broad specificity phosphatase PhoE n=1 Tax=Chitinophaga silvatica TaxID=2282649 RepID=A0A3E1Y4F5_9BACT|nr:histidine phosphatase family protein [Chitinophaga silvatica]RFS19543.1 hypothetical protein DVR12_23215 [Chitinophaga silvatica]
MLKTLMMAVLFAAGTLVAKADPEETTIIFVNSAETESSPSSDPGLSTNGQDQAKSLVDVLEGMEIANIYTTYANRSVATVTPLAEHRKQKLEYFRLNGDQELTASILKDMINRNKGKTIVICSDPELVASLIREAGVKGKDAKSLHDKGCGKALLVKVNKGKPAVAQTLNMNSQKKV